jgi:hypothetical protein
MLPVWTQHQLTVLVNQGLTTRVYEDGHTYFVPTRQGKAMVRQAPAVVIRRTAYRRRLG